MNVFETTIRDRIIKSPPSSLERSLYKVVLGEWQMKTAFCEPVESIGISIVKKMVKSNQENIAVLPEDDPRVKQFVRENQLLEGLLPAYLTKDDVRTALSQSLMTEHLTSAKSDGQAIGLAMKHFAQTGLSVNGNDVKEIVVNLRRVD